MEEPIRKLMPTYNNSTPEQEWISWIEQQPNAREALKQFAKQYHYFSVNQVVAFSRLLGVISPTDRPSLSLLASVLYEELGANIPAKVHSALFERFASACGVTTTELPLSPSQVVLGVRCYVLELHNAFGGSSLPRALATYLFLQSSAVETYGPLLQMLTRRGFQPEEIEFFALHAEVEVEHASAAQAMVDRSRFSTEQLMEFNDQTKLLANTWRRFWIDILQSSKEEAA